MEKFRIVFRSGEWKVFSADSPDEARAKALLWAWEKYQELPIGTRAERDYRYTLMTVAWCHNVKDLKRGQAGYSV